MLLSCLRSAWLRRRINAIRWFSPTRFIRRHAAVVPALGLASAADKRYSLAVTMFARAATAADSDRIAKLHADSWRHAYRGALSDEYLCGDVEADRRQLWESRLSGPPEGQHVLLVEDDDHLLGFACVYVGENQDWGSYLNNIHVTQASQGQGIGRLLLHASAGVCRSSPIDGLYLWVLQSNTKAQAFYARYCGKNSGADVWAAPDGTTSPLYRISWGSVAALCGATANPSIEGTASSGLRPPPAAPHVKRYRESPPR